MLDLRACLSSSCRARWRADEERTHRGYSRFGTHGRSEVKQVKDAGKYRVSERERKRQRDRETERMEAEGCSVCVAGT
jgi:hypothetical protein